MFYLYPSITASKPLAEFHSWQAAEMAGLAWLVGGGIIRSTPTFDFYA